MQKVKHNSLDKVIGGCCANQKRDKMSYSPGFPVEQPIRVDAEIVEVLVLDRVCTRRSCQDPQSTLVPYPL